MNSLKIQIHGQILLNSNHYTRKIKITADRYFSSAKVKTQLVAGVQAQLDEMQVSVELMSAAETEMAAVRDTFAQIQQKCEICTQAIDDFDGILKLKNARENIRHVIEQLDMYDAVPLRVQQLEIALVENPAGLKNVFLQWSSLRIWKDRILAQVQADVSEVSRAMQ